MTAPVGRKRGRYATKVGGTHNAPSVTTVLGVLNKPGLPWAAARETALFAVHHRDEWAELDVDGAVDRLYKHHRGIWDAKADVGTRVHGLAHQWAQGIEVDCPADCGPYLDALEAFYTDWQPIWVEVERTVIHADPSNGYGGTFDAVADLADGRRWLLDVKTGERVWWETQLQLAAYRYAKDMAVYNVAGDLVDTEPMPKVDTCGVIHLQGDGTYALLEVEAGSEQWNSFLQLRRVWAWVSGCRDSLSERIDPCVPPVREEVTA